MIDFQSIKEFVLEAESKALATSGYTLNVVPVSTIKIYGDRIVLVDYFMKKTVKNLYDPTACLAVWTGAEGYQLKCEADYFKDGQIFDEIVEETKTTFPDRAVKGIIVLFPYAIYDISVPNAAD